ncbi:MAG: ABC transporter permease [Chloroflexota bacterium]|nr:MAG: peptide ABC transporter permease [Chloroflexota bacterium]
MRFLLRRLGFYLIALLVAVTINFLIPRMMAGDPVQIMFARFQGRLSPESMESLYQTFGFVRGPLHEQYAAYMSSLLQGNLGISVAFFPVPVAQVIGSALAWTLRLVGLATIISFTGGTLLGVIAAWRRGGFVDTIVLPITGILNSFPYFWLAMLALYIFALHLGWFPLGQAADTDLIQDWSDPVYVMSVIQHMLLPAITIVVTSVGGWLLGMRNNMIGVLAEDYITLAQAKGLPDTRVMLTYAARNAILPSLTGFAMSLGFVLGGALLTEIVFSYPGMGFTLLNAVNTRDYPLMQGIFLIITVAVLVANLIADMAYVMLDPRAR